MSIGTDYQPSYRPVAEGPLARRPRAVDFGRGFWFDEYSNLYHSNGAVWSLVNNGLRAGLPSSGDYLDADTANLSTTATGLNQLRCAPLLIPVDLTLATIGVEITTVGGAGSIIRLGLYADNGNGYPGALLFEAPTTIPATVLGFTEIAISVAVQAGLYWTALVNQVASGTLTRSVTQLIMPSHFQSGTDVNQGGFVATNISGALPAAFPAGMAGTTGSGRVMVKVA